MLRDICLLYFEIGYIIVHQLRAQSLSRRYHLRSKQEKENRNLRSKKKKGQNIKFLPCINVVIKFNLIKC